jgi:hypothetical protein
MAGGDVVVVRDSKDPDGAMLTFNAREWDTFVAGAKAGEFDRGRLAEPGAPPT